MRGLLVNRSVAASGLPSCFAATNLTVLQDDSEGSLWAVLGISGNSYAIVDGAGTLVYRELGATLPSHEDEITSVVEALLEP